MSGYHTGLPDGGDRDPTAPRSTHFSRDSYLYESRMQFAASIGLPRKVTKPRGEFEARMCETWIEKAHSTGREPYLDPRGFADDRRPRYGGAWGRRIHGHEVAYGMWSRAHWRYVWLAMKAAFWSGVHDAMGTTYETTEGGRNSIALVTGIAA
jgi:hypothetical protein